MRGPFEFEWLDAYCPEDRWYTSDDFELEPRAMKTTGWVVYQGSGYMVIAGTYDEAGGFYAQLIAVPICLMTRPPRDVSISLEVDDDSSDLDDSPSDDSSDRIEAGPLEGLSRLGDLFVTGDGSVEHSLAGGCIEAVLECAGSTDSTTGPSRALRRASGER